MKEPLNKAYKYKPCAHAMGLVLGVSCSALNSATSCLSIATQTLDRIASRGGEGCSNDCQCNEFPHDVSPDVDRQSEA
jgi:hypothetical protein